jgi:hypothetical protein
VTIFCVLGFLRAFMLMLMIASPRSLEIGGWYPPGLSALALSVILAAFFFWRMNRRGVWAAALATALQAVVMWAKPALENPSSGAHPVLDLCVPFFVPMLGLVCGAVYWKRMA